MYVVRRMHIATYMPASHFASGVDQVPMSVPVVSEMSITMPASHFISGVDQVPMFVVSRMCNMPAIIMNLFVNPIA